MKKKSFRSIPPPADPRYPGANAGHFGHSQPPATSEVAHTPTPYFENGPHHLQAQGEPGDVRPRVLAQFTPYATDETRAFIIRACNSHAALVETLEMTRTTLEANGWAHDCPKLMVAIRDALALAKSIK